MCLFLQDEFPEAYRFATSVFPSEDDDVITSPYNALLSLTELTEHADAVFPLENQALMDMCSLIQSRSGPSPNQPASLLSGPNAGVLSSPTAEVHALQCLVLARCCKRCLAVAVFTTSAV